MNGKALLDTNAVIAVFARDNGALSIVANAGECFLPTVAAGELYYGAFCSQDVATNISRLNSFLSCVTLLPCDSQTAVHYGRIKKELRDKGKPSRKTTFGSRQLLRNIKYP